MMVYWAFIMLIVAFTAGLIGFGGMGTAVAFLAQLLFFVFLAIAGALVAIRLAMDELDDGQEYHVD